MQFVYLQGFMSASREPNKYCHAEGHEEGANQGYLSTHRPIRVLNNLDA
jgi:hypothetical protein